MHTFLNGLRGRPELKDVANELHIHVLLEPVPAVLTTLVNNTRNNSSVITNKK
jgi:hypothetical protein